MSAARRAGGGAVGEKGPICGVISHSGPHGEPLACAYAPGHLEHGTPHSWASLPTFVDGRVPTTSKCEICGAWHNGEYARDFAGCWGSRGRA